MRQRFDIVIVGAGMIGLTTAALLASSAHRERLTITVIDAGTRPAFDPQQGVALRVSAISIGSAGILDQIRVWQSIEAQRACPYDKMRVWDAHSSVDEPGTLCFDAADFAVPELGFIVENTLVRHMLLDRLDGLGVELKFSTYIKEVGASAGRSGYDVCLRDGGRLSPDLLIGADGGASIVRRGAGIPVKVWQYPQSALVTHLTPESDHRHTAWQRFLQDGPIALLPLGDGRVSVVWSTTPERVEFGMSANDQVLSELLTDASDAVLGRLCVAGPRGSFPLKAQHAVHYVAPGLALVGDAAHSVHPLAGQGANLGFADALALSETIVDGLDNEEYPGDMPTLRRYERARKGANATMLRFIDSLNRLFLSESGAMARLRVTGMRLFNRSGPIRRRAVRVALGINV